MCVIFLFLIDFIPKFSSLFQRDRLESFSQASAPVAMAEDQYSTVPLRSAAFTFPNQLRVYRSVRTDRVPRHTFKN